MRKGGAVRERRRGEAEPGGGRGGADPDGSVRRRRPDSSRFPETAAMPRPDTPGHPPHPPRPAWRARLVVLGPLGVAALVTALGAGMDVAAPLWLAAIAWIVLASLAVALWRGLRHRDWSAFRGHELPHDSGEDDEWAARTGRCEWLGDHEDRLRDDDLGS